MAGLPARQLNRLQSVLSAAARLVYSARRTEHVSPLLHELHWLKVPQRIEFRLSVLAYRCLNSTAPQYLADGYSELPTSARALGCDLCGRRYFTFHGRNTKQSVIGPSRRCRKGLEQSAAVDIVVAPVKKGAEDGIVPTFVRRGSYGDARRWSLIFNF